MTHASLWPRWHTWGLAGLLAGIGLASCTPGTRDGQFRCDQLVPGSCPAGHACQLRPGEDDFRCYRSSGAHCGDGILDPGEECDGTLIPGSCRSRGTFGGRLRCDASCRIDDSACLEATDLACGFLECCAATQDGELYCWGGGLFGIDEADTPDLEAAYAPRRKATGLGLRSLHPGFMHLCGLDLEGAAWCWGLNDSGQLGSGDRISTTEPQPVPGGPWQAIAGGWSHTCALDTDGWAYCWGSAVNGVLGVGPTGSAGTVVPSPVAGNLPFTDLVAGDLHTCGLAPDGTAHCWGLNDFGQLGDGTYIVRDEPTPVAAGHRFTRLGAGSSHACGLDADGHAWCWGRTVRDVPGGPVPGTHPVPVAVPGDATFLELSGGYDSTCGLDASGQAWCWGDGPIGNGTRSSPAPARVSIEAPFEKLAAGPHVHCGLVASGRIHCWGWNGGGNLGLAGPRVTPTPVATGARFAALASSGFGTCGLTQVGAPWCWGDNEFAALGDPSRVMPFSPVAVPDVPALTSVHPGTSLACGLSVDGPLWCWGEYPLGTVHGPGVEQPERTFDAVKTGGYHACALDPEGTAWCWGQNAFGQLGDGTQWDRWTAQPVAGAFAFDRLALSLYSACGVTREGGVACWGANPDRRMIPWADTFVLEPTGFEVPARIARVQPGESATCALDDAGQAWCWGRGNAGTLGDGTGQERAVPAAVRQAVPFVDLVMGAGHACGLADGGTAWCWGYNHVGQVGDGTLTTRFTPVPVTGSRPFVAITAGYTHTCALDDEDAAHCWGGNDTGELGTDDFFATPVEVPEPVLDAP